MCVCVMHRYGGCECVCVYVYSLCLATHGPSQSFMGPAGCGQKGIPREEPSASDWTKLESIFPISQPINLDSLEVWITSPKDPQKDIIPLSTCSSIEPVFFSPFPFPPFHFPLLLSPVSPCPDYCFLGLMSIFVNCIQILVSGLVLETPSFRQL